MNYKNMMSLDTFTLIAMLTVSGSVTVNTRAPPPVDVNKCCRIGESLVRTKEDGADWFCRKGGPDHWAPLVYSPQKKVFLERGTVPLHWHIREGVRPECPEPRALGGLTPDVTYLLFANNGSLRLTDGGHFLAPQAYCADTDAALACVAVETPPTPLPKCCPERHAYLEARGICVVVEGSPAAIVQEELSKRIRNESASAGAAMAFTGWPSCPDAIGWVEVGAASEARFLPDGSLSLGEALLPVGGFCLETWVRREGGHGEARVIACPSLVGEDVGAPRRHAIYGIGLIVGALFLLATLVAGFLVPAAHHALHWRCQTHYVAALFAGNVLLAVTQLAAETVPQPLCKALAVCMHFLFLSAFFWLNTMCFNIWWTFRDFRPTSVERGQEACRLRVYMLYAWGGPLLIAGVAALLDHLPDHPAYTFLRPRFGLQRCWFYGDMEILTYFFGPVGVLLCVNLALFISTTRQLTCGLWRRDEVKSTTERAALGRVCAKLVVVMGVTWVADVISWACGGPDYVWYLTDLINALQGVFIFLVVGCQPQVWASVKRSRVCRVWRRGEGGACTAGVPLHSSSQLPSCGESLTHTTATPASLPPPPPPPPHYVPASSSLPKDQVTAKAETLC